MFQYYKTPFYWINMITVKHKAGEFSGKNNISIKILFLFFGTIFLFFLGFSSGYAASYQEVIFNEINWAGSADGNGSGSSSDEWIELRNTTDHDINIGGFQISEFSDPQAGTGEKLMLEIPAGKIIPAHGFFLITNNPESDSRYRPTISPDYQTSNVNLPTRIRIHLYDGVFNDAIEEANLLDSAGNGSKATLFEGDNDKTTGYRTMSRKYVPGDGTHKNDWFRSSISKNLNIATHNFGSPGNSSSTLADAFPEVVYEDGEDKDSSDWEVYDSNPSGTKIKNQTSGGIDNSRDVKISGAIMQSYHFVDLHSSSDADPVNGNGIALKGINDPLHTKFSFSFKTLADRFTLYARVKTQNGFRYLEYTPGADALNGRSSAHDWIPDDIYVHHGLGNNLNDDVWHSFTRDLQADLNDAPNNTADTIEYVEGIYVRMIGEIDNIKLFND